MRVLLAILVVFSLSIQANAAMDPTALGKGNEKPLGNSGQDFQKANCPPSDAKLYMEFNDVRALVEAGGSLWQNRQTNAASYEVPVGGRNHVLYSGSIWMGGVDVNGQLKLAAILFRRGNDFWTGPLSQNVGSGDYDPAYPVGDNALRDYGAATIDPDVCMEYDRFFPIAKAEVINYTLAFECAQNPDCTDEFPVSNTAIQRINNWPAHGDVSKGQDYYLAPFYDYPSEGGAGDGVYDPSQGDIPWFDDILDRDDVECGFDRRVTLFGDLTNWWVFNDKGNIHTETGADPIGMEIHAQAFSFATNDEVNQMTFYNYEMINRSTQTLYETYFTQYADADVGFSEDDFVGCDVSRGLGYAYNAKNFDEGQGGSPGYGANVPAIGIDFFEGPYQDADGIDNPGPHWEYLPDSSRIWVVPEVDDAIADKGIVYAGIGIGYSDGIIDNERFGMRRFNYFNRADKSPSPAMTDPSTPGDFYNYMVGKWKDNSPNYYGGNGYSGSVGVTSQHADYLYPGNSDPLHWGTGGVDMGFNWSERNSDGNNTPTAPEGGDRRFLQTAGPFTLKPGAVNNLTVGVVFGRAFNGNASASIDVLLKNDTKAQALFDNCFKIMDPPTAPVLEIVELENELVLLIDNPYGNNVDETYIQEDRINIPDAPEGEEPYDKNYRFEGYQIYQMKDEEAKVSDIGNDDKARLVAQCDIKNDVARLVNFEYNEALGFSVPEVKVEGENKGIRHSFKITNDAFNNKGLVNHKTYYYIAIAYAHNEYKVYNPESADGLGGQKIPYISSRLAADGGAIKSLAGIPHSPAPRFDGTIIKLDYGSSPEITTLDGRGNGHRAVELTKATEDFIVENGSIDTPTYKKGRGPIDVKVVDPLNVVGGYYIMKFNNFTDIDTASWVIERYTSKGGDFIESVSSKRTIKHDNEQLIPQWGVSVRAFQDIYPCADGTTGCAFRSRLAMPLEASISFSDSTKQWLSGISDIDSYDPSNWIMSGTFKADQDADDQPELGVFNPKCYKDLIGSDPDKHFAKILEGKMTIGQLARRNTCGFSPIGIPNTGGINANSFSSMEQLRMPSVFQTSVDIVITKDKSKWSRVPVIELGNDVNLNIGGAKPGLLRKSPSVDKNGRKAGESGYVESEANPNGSTPTGMGWFPGYAIDVETGRRLNMAFGENSFLAGENGGDMVWNPTSNIYGNSFDNNGYPNPLLGGQHVVYVFGRVEGNMPSYDEGEFVYQNLALESNAAYKSVYENLSWVYNPLLAQDTELLSSDVRISVRINQQYTKHTMTGAYAGAPTYEWNMDKFKTVKKNEETLASALDMINVVPNPYYAYSEYERDKLENIVKVTNLPERCKVRIYNTSGKLIRAFDKDSPITSIDWDLKNGDNIPVAGGIYLIHVEVPGIGNRVIKFFGGLRQPDLENL